MRKNGSLSINPNTTEVVQCSFPKLSLSNGTVAVIEPHAKVENQTRLCFSSTLIALKAKQDVSFAILKVLPHKNTVQKNSVIARITILTPKQAEYLQPVNPQLLSNNFNQNINAHIQDSEIKVSPSSDALWFSTPENCPNPETVTGIEKRIYNDNV